MSSFSAVRKSAPSFVRRGRVGELPAVLASLASIFLGCTFVTPSEMRDLHRDVNQTKIDVGRLVVVQTDALRKIEYSLNRVNENLAAQNEQIGELARNMERELTLLHEAIDRVRAAAARWVRAQLTSVQLSTYFVGYLEVADLRREVEEVRGEKFDLKTFHDRLLSYGSPPVRFLRALLLDLEIPR